MATYFVETDMGKVLEPEKFNLNAYLADDGNLKPEFATKTMAQHGFRQVKPIRCADGLELSVQASKTHYCDPRDSVGPWVAVEVGYPNRPIEEFLPYAENPYFPTDTVYNRVPVALVEEVIEKHGGIVRA